MSKTEKRSTVRFDRSLPVYVSNPTFGRMRFIARNVSTGGMFVETGDPLPLGTEVEVHFGAEECRVVARAEVRNHYFLNFADGAGPRALAGMGLRFVGFEAGAERLERMLH
ncbi:MAG: PilZ domain-containing protein [Myxococcota bacterium]